MIEKSEYKDILEINKRLKRIQFDATNTIFKYFMPVDRILVLEPIK